MATHAKAHESAAAVGKVHSPEVDAVIFLRDPMTPQPHEPDINALVRACDVHDVPCATNLSTARLVLRAFLAGLEP